MKLSNGNVPSCSTLLLTGLTAVTCVNAFTARFPYGSQVVRGVNLGGWLVLEPWITPSIFDSTGNASVVDEWTLGEQRARGFNTAGVLQNHWNTFYTESDFQQMAAAGLNHVRIPIGFWAFDISGGEPYVQGQYPYLQKAVQWASNHGLKVLIDLHGAPGSQNGFDNSGHKGPAAWADKQSNLDRTNAIIANLAHEFSKNAYANVVVSIQPLNEPASFKKNNILPAVMNLYQYSYSVLRKPFSTNTVGNLVMLIHDAFAGFSTWTGKFQPPQYDGVILDTHSYSVFSDQEVALDWNGHISAKCDLGNQIYNFASQNIWTVVGEWSLASTDCAKYLNGRGIGARYDGTFSGSQFVGTCSNKTGTADKFSAKYKVFLRRWYEAQTSAYEQGQGWFFWTWKTEGHSAADWDYQQGLASGWIPKNPAEKIYGDPCGYNGRSGVSKRSLPALATDGEDGSQSTNSEEIQKARRAHKQNMRSRKNQHRATMPVVAASED